MVSEAELVVRATAALNLRKINRVEGRPLGEVVTAECHREATVVKPIGFTTGALTALACKIAPICLIPY